MVDWGDEHRWIQITDVNRQRVNDMRDFCQKTRCRCWPSYTLETNNRQTTKVWLWLCSKRSKMWQQTSGLFIKSNSHWTCTATPDDPTSSFSSFPYGLQLLTPSGLTSLFSQMSPKPILKRSVSEPYHCQGYPTRAQGVRFPSSPATCTYSAYSASAYDRSPIVVTPNNCALPERGGRTYTLDESQPRRGISFARDFHPRALAFASSRPALPQLIPDQSSESDDSDAWLAAPVPSTTSFGVHGLAGPPSKCNSDDIEMNGYTNCVDALAFLPYPPSSPSQKYQDSESIDPFPHSYRRRRGERESKRERSSSPDRKPSRDSDDTQHCLSALSSLSISGSPAFSSTLTKKSIKKRQQKSQNASCTPMTVGFSGLDDGCLGGFWNHGLFSNALYYICITDWIGLVVPSRSPCQQHSLPPYFLFRSPFPLPVYTILYKPVFLLYVMHWP